MVGIKIKTVGKDEFMNRGHSGGPHTAIPPPVCVRPNFLLPDLGLEAPSQAARPRMRKWAANWTRKRRIT
jgi:hypothetical protein